MSNATVACSGSVGNGSSFVSVGKACRFLDCSTQTIRNLVTSGQIESCLTMGGHRRVSVKSLERYAYGNDAEENVSYKERQCCCYVRVSTEKQNSAGSLLRQKERLTAEVATRENMPIDSIPVYSDVASSFGSRDSLNRLVDDIIDGRIKKIYCEYLDRLSRVPGLTHLINHLCDRYAVEVVCLDMEDTETQDVYQAELLNFLTVWCNRRSSDKAKKVVEKNLDEKGIARLFELRNKGNKIKDCFAQLNKEGFTDSKGGPVSYGTVRKYLLLNGAANKIVNGGGLSAEQIVKDFIDKHIVAKEGGRISANSIYGVYCDYCESLSVLPQARTLFGGILTKIFGTKTIKSNGVRNWIGYAVK